jgi:hypothetical protein
VTPQSAKEICSDANSAVTATSKQVTLSNLYQSGDPGVNKQVLKNFPLEEELLATHSLKFIFCCSKNIRLP